MRRISKKNIKYEDLIQDYIDYCSYKNLAIKTIKSYNQTLMLFTQYLREEKNIEDITKVNKEIVEEYINFTKERGKYSFVVSDGYLKANIDKRKDIGNEVSISTLNNYLRNIKVFFSYLEENNIIKINTAKNCKFIKGERKSKERFTDEEYKKLIKSLDITKFHEYRDYIIIQLIFDSGMRINETLNLSVYDIDLLRKMIYIISEITKGKKDRVVFFSQSMERLLRCWILRNLY